MKTIFTSILLLITILSFSQKNKRIIYSEDSEIKVIYEDNKKKLAEIFVNDTFVGFLEENILTAIDPNKIDSMKIIKEKLNVKNFVGGIMITMKSYYTPNFITVKELISKYLKVDKNPILFQIDNNIVNQNQDKFKVDENYILKIELSKIKTSNRNIAINLINIVTKTEENIKKANEIILR